MNESATIGTNGARTEALTHIVRIYEGSDGDAMKALYARLEQLGPRGIVAANLLRAQKNSSRAKVYRRRYRGMTYDRKQWAMSNLATALVAHGESLGLRWGWGVDVEQPKHNVVLYIDLPTGQVSFHTEQRGEGPDYPGHWDGMRDTATGRICGWCARVMAGGAS
jgi:hypothetical protein